MNRTKQRSNPTKEDLTKLYMLRKEMAHSAYGICGGDTIKTSYASEKYRKEYERLELMSAGVEVRNE